MAPIGEKAVVSGSVDLTDEQESQQNLWSSILAEVSSHSTSKLPSCKSILVLGEDESGKTTLIAKLQGTDEPKKGKGLEYLYLDVRDEDRDDVTRCGVWILDGDTRHERLLKFALTPESLEHTVVMLTVDMSRPWTIMESLNKWARILRDHIDLLQVPPEKTRELEQLLVQHFQEYTEPEEGQNSPRRTSAVTPTTDEEKVLLPLGETTLVHNLGVPIVVVVTKTDAISSLEKEHEYRDEHLDFIQQYVRKFCLNYGAALFYTSVKENKNCDLLYKYIIHRLYNFPFTTQALVVEKDAVFIPSGWDNLKKISILYENMQSMHPDDSYESVINRPHVRRHVQDMKEITAEDEQVFLMKQQALLSKNITPGRQQESPQRTPAIARTPDRPGRANVASVSPITATCKAKMDGKTAPSSSEGVLANFFNSLLSKKPGASPGPSQPPTGTTGKPGEDL
ncbi:cytoplasmic dynein 1 light intermediate chain 2-like isoform X2 [Ptychodera flava]|uniref:cytoplasmic dynein 1 light intermediate chain 2-like isoform X2 n=1 Tax=Ptychodera flava TaxID=63121 RepID=UPI00396AADC1